MTDDEILALVREVTQDEIRALFRERRKLGAYFFAAWYESAAIHNGDHAMHVLWYWRLKHDEQLAIEQANQ